MKSPAREGVREKGVTNEAHASETMFGKRSLPTAPVTSLVNASNGDPYSYDARQYYRLNVYSLVTLVICDVFLIMDYIAFPDIFWLFLFCRLFIVTPAGALVNWSLRYLNPFGREIAILIGIAIASDGIFYPTSCSHSNFAPFYAFCGGCMLLVFSNVVMRLRFWNAVISSTVVWIDMSWRLSMTPAATTNVLACCIFLTAMTALLTLVANFGMERDERGYLLSEQKRAMALAAGGHVFWELDLTTHTIISESQDLSRHSRSVDEFRESMHPDDRPRHEERVEEYLNGRVPFMHSEYRTRKPGEDWRWHDARGRAVEFDRNGKPRRIVGNTLDITEHKKLTQGLEQAREEAEKARRAAEEATRARSEFLANMSHEIRTPMNAVVGMTSLLLDQEIPPAAREYVSIIRSSSDALLTVINDILDFTKIESGKLELEHAPFSIHECIEDAVELVAAKAAEKNLELAVIIDPALADHVYGDSARLRQIIVNLAANAVKFSEKGEVVVTARLHADGGTGEQLDVAVRDTGIGIPADRLGRLFQSFTQVDASTTRRFGGTGLGLAISSRLAHLMKGCIWAESTLGVGSTFEFVIPYEPAPGYDLGPEAKLRWSGKRILALEDNASTSASLEALCSDWGLSLVTVSSAAEAMRSLHEGRWDAVLLDIDRLEPESREVARASSVQYAGFAPPVLALCSRPIVWAAVPDAIPVIKPLRRRPLYRILARALSGDREGHEPNPATLDRGFANKFALRILLAEDNPVNQKVAALLLQRLGYRPDVVANGVEVLESLRRQTYDLILLDIQMPEMDGLEAARRIRGERKGPDRPWLIALTAGAMQADRDQAMASGMDDYLTKPLNVSALQLALERCHAALGRSASLLDA